MFHQPEPIEPGQDQESVWDYPRPPRLEMVSDKLCVTFAGGTVAESDHGYCVPETSHLPVFYFPPPDVRHDCLIVVRGHYLREFKAMARYRTLILGGRWDEKVAWSYPDPSHAFCAIGDYLASCACRVDDCWVGDERVEPQPGDFYGGWITSRIAEPFKGTPGTRGW